MLVEEPHSHGAAQGHVDLEDFIELGFAWLSWGHMSQSLAEVSFFVCVPASLFRFMRSHTINYRSLQKAPRSTVHSGLGKTWDIT